MELREAIEKSMKAYFDGLSPTELKAVSPKGMKYTKKYFDKVGKEFGIDPPDYKKKKGKY